MAKNLENFMLSLLTDYLDVNKTNVSLISLLDKLWNINHLKRLCRDIYLKQNGKFLCITIPFYLNNI